MDGSWIRRLEEASLRAWPALRETDFDGWRLRFADGYTRRANSITPLQPSRLALPDKIATCERLYTAENLPTIFRLTPLAPAALPDLLTDSGYVSGDRTEVRVLSMRDAIRLPPSGATGTVRAFGVDTWLDIFARLSGAAAGSRGVHRNVLRLVPGQRRLLVFVVNDQPVACGMAVLLDGLLGLFDLVTSTDQRNRGYASELLRRSLRWGLRAGAESAYLQVLERNATARRIYDRLGFAPAYQYDYWQPA